MPEKKKVVVVDDSEVVRMKLRGLLEAEDGFELVGEAADGASGLQIVREHQPDLVIMDLKMPGMSGIEATWQLGTISPYSQVLVLTVSAEQEDVTDAIMAGARGYVVKGAKDEEITGALKGVAAGERVISPQVAGKLVERVRGDKGDKRVTTPSPAAPSAPRMPTPQRPAQRVIMQQPARPPEASWPIGWILLITLLGGALAAAIGQGQEIADGTADTETWVRVGLNVVVAFVVVMLTVAAAKFED